MGFELFSINLFDSDDENKCLTKVFCKMVLGTLEIKASSLTKLQNQAICLMDGKEAGSRGPSRDPSRGQSRGL